MIFYNHNKRAGRPALFIIFTVIILSSGGAYGGEVRKLTKANVKAFIEDTAHMTKPRGEFLSPEKVSAYLEKHLSEEARFVSTITYHIPDMPPQSTNVSLDKAAFIETVGKGTDTIEGYENTVHVGEIKINWRGNKAHVKTENTETGFMAVPDENGGAGESVPINGRSICAQTLSLDDGVIRMSNAVCKTDITFSE